MINWIVPISNIHFILDPKCLKRAILFDSNRGLSEVLLVITIHHTRLDVHIIHPYNVVSYPGIERGEIWCQYL